MQSLYLHLWGSDSVLPSFSNTVQCHTQSAQHVMRTERQCSISALSNTSSQLPFGKACITNTLTQLIAGGPSWLTTYQGHSTLLYSQLRLSHCSAHFLVQPWDLHHHHSTVVLRDSGAIWSSAGDTSSWLLPTFMDWDWEQSKDNFHSQWSDLCYWTMSSAWNM